VAVVGGVTTGPREEENAARGRDRRWSGIHVGLTGNRVVGSFSLFANGGALVAGEGFVAAAEAWWSHLPGLATSAICLCGSVINDSGLCHRVWVGSALTRLQLPSGSHWASHQIMGRVVPSHACWSGCSRGTALCAVLRQAKISGFVWRVVMPLGTWKIVLPFFLLSETQRVTAGFLNKILS
jgi:hypothetical protein